MKRKRRITKERRKIRCGKSERKIEDDEDEKKQDVATELYIKLLISIFFYSEERLQKIMVDWIESGLCKQHLVEDDENEKSKSSSGNNKSKKKRKFFTNQINLQYNEHVAYTFFKAIILLKPDLSIIGTDIHLFSNTDISIRLHHLMGSSMKYFWDIYENRKKIFNNQIYPFGNHVLSNAHLSINTIDIKIRLKLMIIFHRLFMKQSKKSFRVFLDEKMKENENCNITDPDECLPIFSRYLERYSEEIMKLVVELNDKKLKLGIYEKEKEIIERILFSFISNIRKSMKNPQNVLNINNFIY